MGLVGGFFGLLGKEAYYYVKGEIKKKIDDSSQTK
jgi:predicted Zn-dependent protease